MKLLRIARLYFRYLQTTLFESKFQSTQFILDSTHEDFRIGNIMKYAWVFERKNTRTEMTY